MAKIYYVSGTGLDINDGLTEATAFRNPQRAAGLVQAGDTVYLMNGIYTGRYAIILTILNKHGSAIAPITFAAYPGHKPILEAHKNNWGAIAINASSYIVIDGLTLAGARDEITLEYALSQKDNLGNPATSGNGISINFAKEGQLPAGSQRRSHHIIIENNIVSNFPGGGIAATQADYITVENNIVSGNSWYSPYGTQGITFLESWNSDASQDYKIVVKGNTVFDNKSLVPWKTAGEVTEGHGIMLDTSYLDGVAYQGKALISNNLTYNNGGAGIQIFKGQNPVEIVNNTTYQNSQVLPNGEIFLNSAKNVRCDRNIFYAKNGQAATAMANSSNISFNNNLAYNGVFKGAGVGNLVGVDPLFVDAVNKNFALLPNTPAKWIEVKQEMRLVNVEYPHLLGFQK
ncbi:MAG: right-handed parallel beta-helix repeat-containing protein [Cyanobacteriota bacterium]